MRVASDTSREDPAVGLQYEAAQGLKWQAIQLVGRQSLSLAVFSILARLLEPSDFGLVGIVAAYLAFINVLVDQGIGTALIQRRDLRPEHLNSAFWFNCFCAVLMCVAVLALADVLARMAGEPRVAPLLRWASAGIVINSLSAVHVALFTKEIDFRHLTHRTLVGNAFGGVVGIAMAWNGYGVWSLIGQQITASVVGTAFLWAVAPWRPSLQVSLKHLSELMTVSASVFATSLLWIFASRIDQLVIGRVAGAGVLGQYVVGMRLAEMARAAIHEPIAAVSMPALAKAQNDHARLRNALYKAMEPNALLAFAVFGGLAAVAPTIVPLVFGELWRSAGSILQLVALYSLTISLSILVHPALLASGGPGRYVFVNIACAIGALAACLVGIRFGVHVLVLLLIANMLIATLMALLFLEQRISLNLWRFCQPCVVPAAGAAAMFVMVTVTRFAVAGALPLWIQSGIEISVGAAVYSVIVWAFASDALLRLRQFAGRMIARPDTAIVLN